MIKRRTIVVLLFFALAGAFLSCLLLLQHYNEASAVSLVSMVCGGETTGGCSTVTRSQYAMFLGIPNAAFGLLFYLSLSLLLGLSLVADPEIRDVAAGMTFYASIAALAVDLVLLYIQAFVLKTYCVLCLASYVSSIVLFVFLLPARGRLKRDSFQGAVRQTEGKVVFVSWFLGTVVLAGAVGVLNLAMRFQDPSTFDERLEKIAYDEYQKAPVQNIDVQGIPFEGPADAPIRIVVYSDFQCPWCRQIAQTIQQHIKRWDPNVAVYFKMYPLDKICNPYEKKNAHPGSCWAALGGLCAQDQGLFWEYHDRVFNTPPRNPRPQDIVKIGSEVGMDTVKLKECLLSGPMRNNVRRQIEDARADGVTATPAIFVNGKKIPRIGYFSSVLTMEARRLGIAPINATGQ